MATDPGRAVSVALVGYGYAGRTFHAPLIGAVEGLDLAVVVSSDAERVHPDLPGVPVSSDIGAVFSDPGIDLVVIASPNATHAPLARAALSAGKHVVVDKPFVLSTADARALAARAREKNRMLSVFQNRRWDSDFLAVRSAIGDGQVGDVLHFESRMERFRPDVRPRWREQPGPGAGLWWDLGPHLVDQVLLLFGVPDAVQASFAVQRPGATVDDWAHVVLDYGERRAVLHASMLAAAAGPRFLVHGTRGSLVKHGADPQESHLREGLRPGHAEWGVDHDPLHVHGDAGVARTVAAPRGDQSMYYVQVRDALRTAAPNPVPAAQASAVIAVIEAAIASACEGRAVAPACNADERAAFAPPAHRARD